MTNQVLARKMADLVRHQLAGVLHAPAIRALDLEVVIATEADTASVGWRGRGDAQVTLPVQFCGQELERDNLTYLGLLAHEVGHLPDLETVDALMAQAEAEGGAVLQTLFNIVEDARIESALTEDPVNLWLTRVRTLAGEELAPEPADLWDFMLWLRFGNPAVPVNTILPQGFMSLSSGYYFWQATLHELRQLDSTEASYRAAQNILASAERHGIPIPQPSPQLQGGGAGEGPQGQIAPGQSNPLAGCELPQKNPRGGHSAKREWEAPDQAALTEGQRLSRQLRSWWTRNRTRHIAGGVGRYNPRLEASGLPPFTLPLVQQAAPPPRLAIFLDISDSMWSGGETRLHVARIATVALVEAVRQAGGQARVWAFDAGDSAVPLQDQLPKIVSLRGYGTRLHFLQEVAPLVAGWDCLFITDAQVDPAPSLWDAERRRSASVLLISADPHDAHRAQELGERVVRITEAKDLPYLTALLARRFFGTATRV